MPARSRWLVWRILHARCGVRATSLVWLTLALALAACDHVTPAPPNAPTPALAAVTTVTINLLPTTFTVGQSVQLTASATLPDGTHLNATSQVTWQSSATAVVTVSATGLLTVVAPGEADVTATLQSVRGVAHIIVAKPSPLVPTYDIIGVVHESAPTQNVMLPGATVGIHFAGCPTCPHEGQETTTDDQGRFTLPGIDMAGFTLWVRKPGYDATPFNVAELPRDQHPDIGLAPQLAIVQETFEGTFRPGVDCTADPVVAGLVDCIRSLTFPVHHEGTITLLEPFHCELLECNLLMRQGQNPWVDFWSIGRLQPGFFYSVIVAGDNPPPATVRFRIVFTHPN